MPQNRIKVFGPPGTGKTTWCLETLSHHLEAGDKVLFVSFTRAAANEGKTRLKKRFGEIPMNATCSTLHSLSLRILGFPKDALFEQFFVKQDFYRTVDRMGLSNEKIAYVLENYHRLRNKVLYTPDALECSVIEEDAILDAFSGPGLRSLFVDRYEEYKTRNARVDFTDLLERIARGEGSIPDYDVVIVDEAQDLSTLQWHVVERIFAKTPHTIYVVGDDDQSVYQFLGADVDYFLRWACTSTQVLDLTYRLPQNFLDYSMKIANRIEDRYTKQIRTEVRQNGTIRSGYVTSHLPMYRYESELYLVRNRYMLHKVQEHLALFGCPYSGKDSPWMRRDVQSIGTLLAWRQEGLERAKWRALSKHLPADFVAKIETVYPAVAERNSDFVLPSLETMFKPAFFEDTYNQWWRRFYPSMPSELRNLVMKGFSVYAPSVCLDPPLELATIHGAKGQEADCVYLCSAVTDKIRRRLFNEDTEHRVFYVGATRAKKELVLLQDQRFKEQYPFPDL